MSVASRSNQLGMNQPNKRRNYLFALILAIGAAFMVYHIFSGDDPPSPIVIDEQGNEKLSPERQGKLDRELEEFDNVEQYALIAGRNQYYPCYSCPNGAKTIFLKKGEVWKYGVTRKGKSVRYPRNNFGAPNLLFVTQFQGNINECLKMEKIKIYYYPLLPEAKQRRVKLIRPPGNAYDS